MRKKVTLCLFAALLFSGLSAVFAQNHVSVPVEDPVYYVLESAQLRGLLDPLPLVKPYTRLQVERALRSILDSERAGTLKAVEREIILETLERFARAEPGLDLSRLSYGFGGGESAFRGDMSFRLKTFFSGAYEVKEKKKRWGTNDWLSFNAQGDAGDHFSFALDASAGFIRAPVEKLGEYNTYYKNANLPTTGPYKNEEITTTSEPVTSFPYTFHKDWDAFVFGAGGSAGMREKWPQNRGLGYSVQSEIAGDAFDSALQIRFGRMRREWGAMAEGGSLVFNANAQPFLGLEASFNPRPWFAFSTLTGILEYYNFDGLGSAWNSQNAFSIEQMEFNYKNYFHLDVGSTVVWPKRFELGYIFPINNNFLYQNNIGDYDNMGAYFNIRGQIPGRGSLWFSFFMDEIYVGDLDKLFQLDRQMFAFQAGLRAALPFLPFGELRLSYTKIEPYTYTHQRIFAPWYDSGGSDPAHARDTAYTNNGAGLGYYLPPNADEILVRVETRPFTRAGAHVQYQLVRHGADHGSRQVDGSNYRSELDPEGRSSKKILEKDFLHDGAYQWMHIVKAGGRYRFRDLPVEVFGEAGAVISYYTGSGSTGEYPGATWLIASFGFKVSP
ncbi:MAG: hypothetical protein LBB82_11055 [Treponema sp.]|jgi:hypothetical protein|nr:hypothetical protein [Treponema sp.]